MRRITAALSRFQVVQWHEMELKRFIFLGEKQLPVLQRI